MRATAIRSSALLFLFCSSAERESMDCFSERRLRRRPETRMDRLNDICLDRINRTPIDAVPRFSEHGLVLGAASVLIPIEKIGATPNGIAPTDKARLLALLSAAYGRLIDDKALKHLSRAGLCWRQGDQAKAAVHLALTGLNKLDQPIVAARRLFLADLLLKRDVDPEDLIREILRKRGNVAAPQHDVSNEPRVPKGQGKPSGQWTRTGQFIFNKLSPLAIRQLARTAIRFNAVTVFLGVARRSKDAVND